MARDALAHPHSLALTDSLSQDSLALSDSLSRDSHALPDSLSLSPSDTMEREEAFDSPERRSGG